MPYHCKIHELQDPRQFDALFQADLVVCLQSLKMGFRYHKTVSLVTHLFVTNSENVEKVGRSQITN
jgi:hypothetical protein